MPRLSEIHQMVVQYPWNLHLLTAWQHTSILFWESDHLTYFFEVCLCQRLTDDALVINAEVRLLLCLQ